MESILPFDNVETINDILTQYHFNLVPSLGSKYTYELIDNRDYYSPSITFPTSCSNFIFWATHNKCELEMSTLRYLHNLISSTIQHAHRYHYIIPVALTDDHSKITFWGHYDHEGVVGYKLFTSKDLINWFKQPEAQLYSYEVETIIKSQPFYLKQSIVGAVKCVEGLSDGLD